MYVVTVAALEPFYNRFGFDFAYTREGFFANPLYDPKRFAEGEDIRDMRVLSVKL